MDIRTKLALSLVSMSLFSMLVIGTFAYQTASELLRQASERQLDALAEGKRLDIEKVIDGWRDRVQLIRSRTRLRTLVARGVGDDDEAMRVEIRRILDDAIASVKSVDRVTIFDTDGKPIASAGTSEVASTLDASVFEHPDAVLYGGVTLLDPDRIVVRFFSLLELDGAMIGAMEVTIDGEDLRRVTQNYTGLGETGESLVVMRDPSGGALVLSSLRHDRLRRRIGFEGSPYLVAALDGTEGVFGENVQDYRGIDVWGATRTLPDVAWGIVVKMDRAEESLRADWLRDQLVDLGLALGAVAILGGTFLGFRLGRPLRGLTEVVERIRAGERTLRADTTAPDEVGFLAEALNDLLDEHPPPS